MAAADAAPMPRSIWLARVPRRPWVFAAAATGGRIHTITASPPAAVAPARRPAAALRPGQALPAPQDQGQAPAHRHDPRRRRDGDQVSDRVSGPRLLPDRPAGAGERRPVRPAPPLPRRDGAGL